MTQSFERALSRLDNIKAIKPLLSALRTMSMSAWQSANRKIAYLQEYEVIYHRILAEIMPSIKQKVTQQSRPPAIQASNNNTVFLIVGSERGLCGKFNTTLADKALAFIHESDNAPYQIWVMGSRLLRELQRRGTEISWQKPLPASSLTSYKECYALIQNWLYLFEVYEFDRLIILYNKISKGSTYQFENVNLLPYQFNHLAETKQTESGKWPPPIIETDPIGIYNQIIQFSITTTFYQILLQSASAEHSARYHLMQEASENAEEIIEELVRVINAERKRQITQEMQELAMSAGLLEHH